MDEERVLRDAEQRTEHKMGVRRDMTGLGDLMTVQATEFWICWRRDN